MKKLLIECTYVFYHPQIHSGIQRVVRNIVDNLESVTSTEFHCMPVVIKDEQVYHVKQMTGNHLFERSLCKIKANLEGVRNHLWLFYGHFERHFPFRSSLTMRRALILAFKIMSLGYWIPLTLFKLVTYIAIDKRCMEQIEVNEGDVLLLLDSTWHCDFFDFVRELKKKNIYIISVIYDLIPITHTRFCPEHLVKVFNGWLDWMLETADGYIAISKTIASEFKEVLKKYLHAELSGGRWVDSFYLGADFTPKEGGTKVRRGVVEVFNKSPGAYLTVSTIEPRKNHAYMLDAFELLWQDGHDVALYIVGKVGYKTEFLVNRIKRHEEFNKRLFMLNDLNDDELEYSYSYSKALIFASYVEGFGLPLVEAAQRGLPVLCSDIPVFREVGGGNCEYFDLADASSLKNVLIEFEVQGNNRSEKNTNAVEWISWAQSAQQLITVAEHNIRQSKV